MAASAGDGVCECRTGRNPASGLRTTSATSWAGRPTAGSLPPSFNTGAPDAMTSRDDFVAGPDGPGCCPPESRCRVPGSSGSCCSKAGAAASRRFTPFAGVSGDSRLLPPMPGFRVDSAIVSGWTRNPDCSGSSARFGSADGGSRVEETAGTSAARSARRDLSSSSASSSGFTVTGPTLSPRVPSVSSNPAPCQTASHASRPDVLCSISPLPGAAGACPSSSNRTAASGVAASIGNGVTPHR